MNMSEIPVLNCVIVPCHCIHDFVALQIDHPDTMSEQLHRNMHYLLTSETYNGILVRWQHLINDLQNDRSVDDEPGTYRSHIYSRVLQGCNIGRASISSSQEPTDGCTGGKVAPAQTPDPHSIDDMSIRQL
ncbi:unnamed protein product [Aspergillus oryzae]|nr:unnamed protein product [Aspergillus oryzae]